MSQKSFKVGTFNLYNLALPGEKYYNRSYPKDQYEKKVDWLARQLNAMDADIVGFQEVFSEAALQEVLAKTGRYNNATLQVSDRPGRGPAVGLVSCFPVLGY